MSQTYSKNKGRILDISLPLFYSKHCNAKHLALIWSIDCLHPDSRNKDKIRQFFLCYKIRKASSYWCSKITQLLQKKAESLSCHLTFLNVLMRFLLEFVARKNFTSSVNFNTLLFENNFSFVLSFCLRNVYFYFLLNLCFSLCCFFWILVSMSFVFIFYLLWLSLLILHSFLAMMLQSDPHFPFGACPISFCSQSFIIIQGKIIKPKVQPQQF